MTQFPIQPKTMPIPTNDSIMTMLRPNKKIQILQLTNAATNSRHEKVYYILLQLHKQ